MFIDKYNIRPDAEAALQQILNALTQRYPTQPFQMNGHTDSIADAVALDSLLQQYGEQLSICQLCTGTPRESIVGMAC